MTQPHPDRQPTPAGLVSVSVAAHNGNVVITIATLNGAAIVLPLPVETADELAAQLLHHGLVARGQAQ